MCRFFLLVAITGLGVLAALPVAAFAQQPDPVSVVKALIEAMNTRNVEAALALFAEDGVLQAPQRLHSGAAMRAWLEDQVALNLRINVERDLQVAGDKVTWAAKISRDDWQRLGLPPLDTSYEAVVQGGKVKSFAFLWSPEVEARLRAAQAPATLPRAGESTPPVYLATGVAALLVVIGLALRRFSGKSSARN